jgi:hypothetical protein
MGLYSDFERNERDWYPTPLAATVPLFPHLKGIVNYMEPFAGDGKLVDNLSHCPTKLNCRYIFDIEPQREDVNKIDLNDITEHQLLGVSINLAIDAVITNPPWVNTSGSDYQLTRFCNKLCSMGKPVIMLLKSAYINNVWFWNNSAGGRTMGDMCYQVLPIGRVKWIEDSAASGKEDCSWYFFKDNNENLPKVLPRRK